MLVRQGTTCESADPAASCPDPVLFLNFRRSIVQQDTASQQFEAGADVRPTLGSLNMPSGVRSTLPGRALSLLAWFPASGT